jgi:hypothetical protein
MQSECHGEKSGLTNINSITVKKVRPHLIKRRVSVLCYALRRETADKCDAARFSNAGSLLLDKSLLGDLRRLHSTTAHVRFCSDE